VISIAQPIQGFQFNKNVTKTYEIRTITYIQPVTLVLDRQHHLSVVGDTSFYEFPFQCSLIDRFQEARFQMPMDFHCGPYDRIRLCVSMLGTSGQINLCHL